MGGGFIKFPCSNCGKIVKKETFFFLANNEKISSKQKDKLKKFFSVIKEPYYNHSPDVGFIQCVSYNDKYAVYISGDEVQMGRYQTALVAVAECKVWQVAQILTVEVLKIIVEVDK